MSGGEIVARVLKEEQIRFLFTLCGGHISPILVSAKQAGIRVVDTRHEANAVFSADALARITGITGVAAVTAGPGITNTITAIKNASMAQSPIVLLGGAVPTLLKGRAALQDIDQMKLMKPLVKWAAAVRRTREIYPMLKEAFQRAKEGVPGPVFVELPLDVLYDESAVRAGLAKATTKVSTLRQRITAWYVNRHFNDVFRVEDKPISIAPPYHPSTHRPKDLHRIISALSKAQRPVLLIGSGAMMIPSLADSLAQSITILNIPTYLSGMARGLLGPHHPLQYRHHRKETLREADLVLLAGVPCDFRLEYGRHISGSAKVIGINRSLIDLNKNRRPSIGIHSDPMHCLIDLAQQSKNRHDWSTWKNTLNDRESKRESTIQSTGESDQGIHPVRLFLELEKSLPSNAVIVADGGDFVGTSSYIVRPRTPFSWLDPGVFGTLGIGGGFALGAKLGNPDAEVYIIYGDGSSAYSLMEFDTFIRHQLPVIAIIGNDASWSQIARDQLEILKDDCGTVLAYSDYEKVAQAFGGQGKRVSTMTEFQEALAEARISVKQGVPFIINVILTKSDFRKGSLSV